MSTDYIDFLDTTLLQEKRPVYLKSMFVVAWLD